MEMEYKVSHPTVLALNLPSCAILAVDSRVCGEWANVLSNTYNKLIEIRPNVFLGCFGDCIVIDQVVEAFSNLPNPLVMGEIALFVQNTVNTVLDNSRDEDGEINREARFVLLGRVLDDSSRRHYFYNISKGEDTWMFFAKREVGNVVCAGSDAVTTFLGNNNLDENMTEDEAVDYAFKCMKYAVEHDWCAGGRIQVVAMKLGSSIVHTWVQNDPSRCVNAYHYQEPRIINHGDSETVSPDGKRAST